MQQVNDVGVFSCGRGGILGGRIGRHGICPGNRQFLILAGSAGTAHSDPPTI